MDRRSFVAGGIATLLAPLASKAQPVGRVYRIAILSYPAVAGDPAGLPAVGAFVKAMRGHGWEKGANIDFVLRRELALG